MIDKSLVVGDLLFATHRDRAVYLGNSTGNRPRWLKENPCKWRRIQDPQQEAAPQQPLVEGEITIGARQYADARRVASLLGVSRRTLSRWDVAGTGPPKIKIGAKVLFDLGKIPDWLTSRETRPAPAADRNTERGSHD